MLHLFVCHNVAETAGILLFNWQQKSRVFSGHFYETAVAERNCAKWRFYRRRRIQRREESRKNNDALGRTKL